MSGKRHHVIIWAVAAVALLLAWGCANRGMGPQGGPKDVTPPRLLRSVPGSGELNVKSPVVELTFDEIVQVESSFEKVVISPPQGTPPVIKALGHKVKVELKDSLMEGTTYTIDFTDAVVDNNEGNKLEGLSLGFSTGDHLDSLRVSGTVVDAETLNPVAGLIVGIHSDVDDTAFTSTVFDRISKSDGKGRWTVSNVAHGGYRVYGLGDMGNNYRFDLPTERIAFGDSVYVPRAEVTEVMDTFGAFFRDSVTGVVDSSRFVIDSVVGRSVTRFEPEGVVLLSFVERDPRHYMLRGERRARERFSLMFSSKCDTLPQVRLLNVQDTTVECLLQRNATGDTLTYWWTDTVVTMMDTLRCEVRYFRIDMDTQYRAVDTLSLVYREPKGGGKGRSAARGGRGSAGEEKRILSSNASSGFDVYRPLELALSVPSRVNDTCSFVLQQKVDTVYRAIEAVMERGDSIGLSYVIRHEWEPEGVYRLTLDSGYFVALDSTVTQREEINLRVKSLEEYGKIIFEIKNYRGNEVIQLLDKSDKVVRQVVTAGARTTIEYLTPGVYFARLFADRNGNGVWDTGSYREGRQPEEVYYFPYEIELRAFWDVEEEWDVTELPLLKQKPEVLIKAMTNGQ